MKVVGWNNGSHNRNGSGYGIRIVKEDRDAFFQRNWESLIIEIDGQIEVEVNISDSFWQRCNELRSTPIGRWMIRKMLAPWQKGYPPFLTLLTITDRKFRLS